MHLGGHRRIEDVPDKWIRQMEGLSQDWGTEG